MKLFWTSAACLKAPKSWQNGCRRRILQELQLPCSLGAATNKLVAKIATDFGKAAARGEIPPNAITIVPPGQEAAFLAPLPVRALWGVGPKTEARLAEMNILTMGDLASLPEKELVRVFGKPGYDLSVHARGIDDRPVTTYHETKSISQEITFARDIRDAKLLHNTITKLVRQVSARLREENLYGSTVKLKLRWPDFTTISRQSTLALTNRSGKTNPRNCLAFTERGLDTR